MSEHSGNQLGQETSPYLRQHKDNPVHWRPWGPEAFAEAKRTGKPVLLSVGYAACHWCHVMAHESFEDPATAAVMNDLFVNIKVDREERPDVDSIYMNALHLIGEQGGWPLTMFLTPDAEPFWGGTYFPKEPRYGRPAFVDVLRTVSHTFHEAPQKVRSNADALSARLKPAHPKGETVPLTEATLQDWTRRFLQAVDPSTGGMRGAPKFPQTQFFALLWRAGLRYGTESLREAVDLTLTHICQGGIYDHVGGGFARYSVDEQWLVPHFEKMLYDNALLVDLMTEVWRETKSPLYARRIEETVGWLLREMVAQGGAFAASLDADSEGEEGKFYVWDFDEVKALLGKDDINFFADIYDITPPGNFEGKNIPNRLYAVALRDDATEARLSAMLAKMLECRSLRIRPGFDDKILADWNGLMIAALANAATAFDKPEWLAAAEAAFDFILMRMSLATRLIHSYRDGPGNAPATASDYANMIRAALALANATNNPEYVEQACAWTHVLDTHYWAEDLGGYHLSADDTNDILVRPLSGNDDATPNANAMMVSNLVALSAWTGNSAYTDRAEKIIEAFGPAITANPVGHAGLLGAALDLLAPALIVLMVPEGEDPTAMRAALADVSLPNVVVDEVWADETLPSSSPASGKTVIDGATTAYVCIGPQCSLPVTEPEKLVDTIKTARQVTVA
ncbi:thymidylate kinase [Methyloceanibacter methanicus]|uniref:Thymidylate kinase n=1 Tax=Methyloceanibacter methanicus TaxID=1774968 RepID=A0A1E3W7T2_9HYPH|nr:thioredoxin domain-containing protein [Methyloceanibacter methanicus]ODS01167.1 thymidylate kinase [Methyloceanibacter methanicus]